jgi:hypothetical protein
VRAYAESKTAVKFIWNPELTYEYARQGRAGYQDVINLSLYGKEFVINELKYDCDLTEDFASNPAYGVPTTQMHYNVVWFPYQSDIWFESEPTVMFALIYG